MATRTRNWRRLFSYTLVQVVTSSGVSVVFAFSTGGTRKTGRHDQAGSVSTPTTASANWRRARLASGLHPSFRYQAGIHPHRIHIPSTPIHSSPRPAGSDIVNSGSLSCSHSRAGLSPSQLPSPPPIATELRLPTWLPCGSPSHLPTILLQVDDSTDVGGCLFRPTLGPLVAFSLLRPAAHHQLAPQVPTASRPAC